MSDGTANISLPSLDLSGSATETGNAIANIRLPSIVVYGLNNKPLTLPSVTISANSLTGTNTRATLPIMSLKPIILSGSGITANNGSGKLTLPSLLTSGGSPNTAFLRLKPIAVVATGETGTNATAIIFLKAPLINGTATFENLANANLTIGSVTVSASGLNGINASFNKSLPRITMSGIGQTGTISSNASQNITLPLIQLDSTGVGESIGTATISLPAIEIVSRLLSNVVEQNADSVSYAMNTQTRAFTKYQNFSFNSYATFNGRTLGANATGLFDLSGDDDDGVPIDFTATTGILGMGSEQQKHLDSMYFLHKVNGDLNVRLLLDGEADNFYDYTLESLGKIGNHINRLKVGKGIKGQYFQIEISGQAINLELDSISTEPLQTSRKVK